MEDTCKKDWAITVTVKSEKHNFTFWSREQRGSHLIMLQFVLFQLSPAGNETPFSSFPLWPGNYPNLPSSCAPAPVPHWLGPPLWLHYQCWSLLMARQPHCANCWQRQTRGECRRRRRRKRRRREQGEVGRKKLDTKEQKSPWRLKVLIITDVMKSHCSSMEDITEGVSQRALYRTTRPSSVCLW